MLSPLRTVSLCAFALIALVAPVFGQEEPLGDSTDSNPIDVKRRWRMERADRLKAVDLQEVEAEGNFVFYIQQAFGQGDGYNERTVKMHLPWLQAAEKMFDDLIVAPTGLSQDAPREPVAIIVLNTTGDMTNYLAHGEFRCVFHGHSGYDVNLAAIVMYSLTAKAKTNVETRAQDLVHNTVHALWQANTHELDKLVGPSWICEAVADHISMTFGKTASETGSRASHEAHALFVSKALTLSGFSAESLSTLEDLTREIPRGKDDLSLLARLEAVADDQVFRYWASFTMQGVLLFDYLLSGSQGIHKDALYRYLSLILNGKTGPNTFREGMGTSVLSDLEVGYWQSILETAKRVDPTLELNAVNGQAQAMQAATNLGATLAAEPPRIAANATAASDHLEVPGASGDKDVVDIKPPTWSQEDLQALALYRAKGGNLEGALETLDAWKRSALGGVVPDDMEALRTRFTQALQLREECIQWAVESGTRFKVLLGGKGTNVVATAIAPGGIELAKGRDIPASVPLQALTIQELLRITKKAAPKVGTPELVAFLGALSETARWDRTLKAELGKGILYDELKEECEQLAALAETGAIVATIQSLIPGTPTRPKSAIPEIAALLGEHAEHELVKRNLPFLSSVARELLIASFTDADIPALLEASNVSIQGDLISMNYDFESESALLDFPPSTTTGSTNYFRWEEPTLAREFWKMGVEGGELLIRGESLFRHILPLSTPIHISYTACNRDTETHQVGPGGYVGIIACDDLETSYIFGGSHASYLLVMDDGEQQIKQAETTGFSFPGKFFTVELAVDAAQVKIFQSNPPEDDLVVPLAGPRQGYTQLFIRAECEVVMDSITIEGTLNAEVRAQIAVIFAESQLRKLGLL